jgi:site-specific DNA-cytosine methylase
MRSLRCWPTAIPPRSLRPRCWFRLAYVVADTLTSGSHPGSNMPGRRREDDTNLVAFDWQSGGDVRRLTPVECERLQGLPDGWTLIPGAPDSRRYAGLGDAVTSPVAEWIGRRILEAAA